MYEIQFVQRPVFSFFSRRLRYCTVLRLSSVCLSVRDVMYCG